MALGRREAPDRLEDDVGRGMEELLEIGGPGSCRQHMGSRNRCAPHQDAYHRYRTTRHRPAVQESLQQGATNRSTARERHAQR